MYCMAAMGLASCVEEEFLQDELTSSGTFSLTVTQEQKDQTKLAFGDDFLTTYWEDGDALYLQKVDDSNKRYTLTTSLDEPSTEAVFTCEGALAGGTYYVYYYYGEFGGEIFWDNNAVQERGPYAVEFAGDRTPLYGTITIKKGQSTAEVELKPVYSMLRFTIKNNGEFQTGGSHYVGMVAPKSGFAQKVTLQANGTLTETMNRQPKWEICPSRINEINDRRALILPVDLSDQDVYFYVSHFKSEMSSSVCEEYIFEFKKLGKELKAGVCYNITLDLDEATKYDLSDHELSCPGDFRALSYHAHYFSYDSGGGNYVTVPYTVAQDIDFKGEEYFPITASTHPLVIDGNGKTLSNISIDWPIDGAGLVGSGDVTISNLTIDKATIKGKDYVGAFCGSADSSTHISKCKLINSTIEGGKYIGGLLGGPSDGGNCSISDCNVENSLIKATSSFVGGIAGQIKSVSGSEVDDETDVKGTDYVGGIAGAANGTVSRCSSSATVSAAGSCVGGVLGATQSMEVMYTSQGSAYMCANMGSVTGKENVGGIVGYGYSQIAIDQCYSTGSVSGESKIGGIAGFADQPITYCYNIGNITGTDYVGGIVGECTPKAGDKLLKYCYSAGYVSSDKGIIGGFPESPYSYDAFVGCITTSPEIGDSRKSDEVNTDPEHTNLTDINSKISIIDPDDDMYLTDRVWDLSINPNNCTILLWQGDSFGVEVGTGN